MEGVETSVLFWQPKITGLLKFTLYPVNKYTNMPKKLPPRIKKNIQ